MIIPSQEQECLGKIQCTNFQKDILLYNLTVLFISLAGGPTWRQLLIMLIHSSSQVLITPDFYLHHNVEVADQDSASGSLWADALEKSASLA